MLQAIVFDFDGVIADTEPLHWRAFIDVLEPLGISFDYDTYLREYIGFDDRDAFRYVSANHDLNLADGRLEEMVERKAAAFARIVGEGIAPFPGSVELIRATAAAWPIAIASGALRADIDLILPAIGDGSLPPLFKAIVTADNVTKSKPDPETYTLAAQRLGVDPRRCLAIEDTPTGLQSARAAGLRTLAVAHSYPAARLEPLAEHVVQKFPGITAEQIKQWYA
jgi:beta-phosphoglucomutase-like phosphatase (HAD superfamily)